MAIVPEDIICEILLQLPVKSLGRFRLVSKSWNSLISEPRFTQSHLTQNPDNDDYLILYNYRRKVEYISILSRNNLSENRFRKLPYSISKKDEKIRLIGSINGLVTIVYLFKSLYHFILWNPTISRSKKISPPTRFRNTSETSSSYLFAFGCDLVLNDYKLIVKFPKSSRYIVYSSKQDSWSDIFVSKENLDKVYSSHPTIVKGCPYWSCSGGRILKFEIESNDFRLFQLSDFSESYYTLLNVNDCPARVEVYRGAWPYSGPAYMDVYCFNEECKVWRKMYTTKKIYNSYSYRNLMCFKCGGEIVFDEKRCLYDHKSKQIKPIAFDEEGCFCYGFSHGFSHTPSLVLVKGMKAV